MRWRLAWASIGVVAAAPVLALAMGGCEGHAVPVWRTTGVLHAVTAVSARDVWAVGQAGAVGCGCARPLIIHWDGHSWTRVPSPDRGGGNLAGVSFSSTGNGWAVGVTREQQPLILRWDGAAWTRRPAPSLPGGGELTSVAAVSARLAWAVGDSGPFATRRTLILRWNGAAWTRVPSPSPPGGGILAGVAAGSGGKAWAVGSGGGNTLAAYWNGRAWAQVARPRPGALQAVAFVSPSSAWAVGYSAGHHNRTLILRWTDAGWTRVPSPSPARGCIGAVLWGVTAASRTGAWAVGGDSCDPKTLILRWDGSAWTQVYSPTPAGSNFLESVAATRAGGAWAVGSAHGGTGSILTESWNGISWQ
jgi:hypothetical protein